MVSYFVWGFAAICLVLAAIALNDGPMIKQKGAVYEKRRYRNVDS